MSNGLTSQSIETRTVTDPDRERQQVRPNVGGLDRLARIVVSIALLVYGYRNRSRPIGTLAFIVGSDLLATAIIQRCPVNALLGIDTCGEGR